MRVLACFFSIFITYSIATTSLASPDVTAVSPFSIAAVVGEQAITHHDIRERIKFIIATTGLQPGANTAQRLYPRVINSLIEESLQVQEAERYGLRVSSQELSEAVSRIEREQQKPTGSLIDYLANQGIEKETLMNQLRAQIAWGKVLQQRVIPRIRLSDNEILQELKRTKQRESSIEEAQLASIILPVIAQEDPKRVEALSVQIVEDLRKGASFPSIARQLSSERMDLTTPRWLPLQRLDQDIAAKIRDANTPSIIGPLRIPAGYQIISLVDKRRADYRINAEVFFKQIVLELDTLANKQELDLLMTIAQEVRKNPGSCTGKDVAGAVALDDLNFSVSYVRTKLSEISPEVLPLVRGIRVGEISEPFASPEGIRLLKLCERAELPISDDEKETFRRRMKEEKFHLEAVRYLRDLRRNSFVDIRI